MKLVARRTGLSPHVIRAWERRYSAVVPRRTKTNRRSYSEADVERLQLLARLVNAGYGIGQIADRPTQELVEMATVEKALETNGVPRSDGAQSFASATESALARSEQAIRTLDGDSLKSVLTHSSLTMGYSRFIDELLAPLIERIGDLWGHRDISIAHEHLASAVIRTFLGSILESIPLSPDSPVLVSTTPTGQLHELGALLSAATASSIGWKAVYLGPNLPATEISAASRQYSAKAVALSLVYPLDDPAIASQLQLLVGSLAKGTQILAGGRAATSYSVELAQVGAILFRDLLSLRDHLSRL
jgi:DNA-binding transcriptional MerR regulator